MGHSPVEKALQIRANWLRKTRRPQTAAAQRLRPALELSYLVDKHLPRNEQAQLEARRNLVIALVASFEIYWRETFRHVIDRERISADRFKKLDRVTFSLAEADTILGKKLSLGELVACCHTFQSAEAVNGLASAILGRDFFREFHGKEFLIAPADRKDRHIKPAKLTGAQVFEIHLPNVVRCMKLRHDLVHDWPSRVRISRKEVGEMHGSISTWNIFVGASFHWQLSESGRVSPVGGANGRGA